MLDTPKVRETNYEIQMREEYICYNEELDLWNTTILAELNRKDEYRRMMEKMRI